MARQINGLSVNIYGAPEKRPVIFVHGFPFDHNMWKFQVEAFQNDYYCIAYDIRGLGQSEIGDGQYTMEQYCDDLFMVIEELKLEKPVICSLSMGGYISLRAVERDQNKFGGLILCDTRADADNDEGKLRRAGIIKQINKEGADNFIESFVSGLFSGDTKEEYPALVKSVISRCKKSDPAGIKGALLAMLSRTDTGRFLSSITIPTLILCGSYDTLTPPIVMRAMADKIKGSDYASIPRAGHLAPLENPSCVNDLIEAFLKWSVK